MTAHRNDWRRTIILFAATGLVESLAFGHLGAFTPLYLEQLHVRRGSIPVWTGILSSLGFVIGLPLLPFWGVWADRYGRKLIIIRSSVAGAILFAMAGLSVNVWMLAFARFLSGFVLGNTGIMMAVQAEITPRERLGAAISIISAGSPVGMAAGPYLGGQLVKLIGISHLLLIDSALTACVALALLLFLREEPRHAPTMEGTRAGVLAALKAIFHTPIVATLFVAVFLIVTGMNMSQPYVPLLVERLFHGPRRELAPTIGWVLTLSGIAMAVMTPFWGHVGDRRGHRQMLRLCAIVVAFTLVGQAVAHGVGQLAVWRVVQGLSQSGLGALSMVLLALYTPPERRTSILTMSLLPNQLAWFLGPLAGSILAKADLLLPFWIGAALTSVGWAVSLRLPAGAAAEPVSRR